MRVLQRVVMPIDHDPDVLKLYVDARNDGAATEFEHGIQITGRRSISVPSGRRVSFCTYFNAFPASYWRRWSIIEEVFLRVRIRGIGTVIVYRSSAKGHSYRVSVLEIRDGEVQVALPLTSFIDGGWYWFDVVAGDGGTLVEEAEWSAREPGATRGSATVGITTYNRPEFCVDQLLAFGNYPEVLELLDEVVVVDQGTKRVDEHPDFDAAKELAGEKLKMIHQPNLGGSGGFARAMQETLEGERSDYVLLLDDDVVAEPEGIIRAITFADMARTPTIVGGQMFSLYDRSLLHAFGEGVEPYRWFYRPASHTHYGHDFARASLRTTPWLHRRIDVDYNAWWMCLIPVDVLRKIGLALPFFIKWDDAEFGVRAKHAGFPTVSLPGAAVWHVPWHDKDDTLDWQAYYHARNRIIAALLHSPYKRGGNLVRESLLITAKHALSMQYSSAELILTAIEDVLSGPGHLHPALVSKLPQIDKIRAGFIDARSATDLDDFPAVRRQRPPRKGREYSTPEGRAGMMRVAVGAALKNIRPTRDSAKRHPEIAIPHVDQRWWLLTQFDSALVSSADGTRTSWYQRDSGRYGVLMIRATALHGRLLQQWPRLRQRYRAALPELVSPETWQETFTAGRTVT